MPRSRRFVIAATLAMCLVLPASPAAASMPQPVTIDVVTDFNEVESPFQATGDVVCAEGTASNLFLIFVGGQSGTHAQILVGKHFVCPDGTFDILLRVKLDFETGTTNGTWSVLGGTDAYAALRGTGSLTGESLGTDAILDVYTGSMHLH